MTSQEEPTITAISPTSTLGTAAASEHQPEISSPTDREQPPPTVFPNSPPLPGAADLITSRVLPKKISDVNTDEVVNKNDMAVESIVPPQDRNLESPNSPDTESFLAETVKTGVTDTSSQQPIQQTSTGKNCLSDSINQSNMSQTESQPVTTNDTVTITTVQPQVTAPSVKPVAKFILSSPADSPDTTPISSPVVSVEGDGSGTLNHFSTYSNTSQNNLPHDQINLIPTILDDSYSSEPLDYCHSRFPPSNHSISRTQQKLLLQRDYFLADDENYIIHPHNQRRLTKAIERINREHAAISLYRDPMIESLQRTFAKYAQDHPEVLDDDFGASYEDSKEWGILSDQTKSVDQIGSTTANLWTD
ncbi:12583_t:CDS:2 [Gigaspora rosea]|nr:12583_t:CDS:2 [Gigaspora rosea]